VPAWTPIAPLTVATGYHAIEFSFGFNVSRLHMEAGDFWGHADVTGASAAVAVSVSSFAVSNVDPVSSFSKVPSDSLLSVPWAPEGPVLAATLVDGSSNAITTQYNHQRKVVRAGDVAGQTACDATNSDGCWYVVFFDQLTETDYTSPPGTETITTGTKVSGTFSSSVRSSNNAYINYRETNTGSQTTVTNNAGAAGTNPACGWTSCSGGQTSDNAYATSAIPNQRLSYKTFGFVVPSTSTIDSVRVGVEAHAVGDDDITTLSISWNAGSTYCSNTQTHTTIPAADPNAYTYFDFTTCTGHTWAVADFSGDNIAFDSQYLKVGPTADTISVDAVAVEVKYTPIEYTLSVRYDFASVPNGDAVTLRIEAYHTAGEDFAVQVLTPPATWTTRITITATTDPNSAQTYALTSTEWNSGSPGVRFVDTVSADSTQSDVWIDLSLITTTLTKSPSTETVTTGTKVSGTFAADVSTSNNAYINYREANAGSPTTVTNDAGAAGTSPACAWTNCANGRTSDNSYATSSVDTTVISYKTFGFSLPSDIAINSVRTGIELFTSSNDKLAGITLSWDAGTTYCTNTQTLNSVPGADPNAYTYFDFTTCTGHTWAQADFTGDNIAFKASQSAQGLVDTMSFDAVVVEVTYTPYQYQLLVRHDFANVAAGDAYTLKIEAYHTSGEDVSVQVLTPPSTWTTRITITATSDPNSAQTYTLTSSEYNSGAPAVRFIDAGGSDLTQSDLWVDMAVITTTVYWDRVSVRRSSDTSGSTWGSQLLLASGRVEDDPLLYLYDSAEPAVAIDASGYLHIAWVSASSGGNQQTLNRVRYTKTTVAHPSQSQLASAANWDATTTVDDSSTGFMPTVSTDSSNNPHLAWSSSKTSGTVYYKNKAGGTWRSTVSWGTTYTGLSVDVSPQNNYVSLARYYEAATNEIQYAVCKDLSTSNCDASGEFTKWDGSAGYDTVATAVETASYPSLATSYESNGDLWVAYAKDVDGSTRAIYARFLNYPSSGWAAAETVDSLASTLFTQPSIGVDKNNDVHALYVTMSGALYFTSRVSGTWGTRTSVDTSSNAPSLIVRAPNHATYGVDLAGIYWKTSTSETYFYRIAIPEFSEVVVALLGIACIVLSFRRVRRRREQGPA